MNEQTNNTELNKRAQERFNALRTKMGLDIIEREKASGQAPINTEKLERLLNGESVIGPIETTIGIEDEVEKIDKVFEFIEDLELPNNLSLAIAQIISFSKSNNKADLHKAISAINAELGE